MLILVEFVKKHNSFVSSQHRSAIYVTKDVTYNMVPVNGCVVCLFPTNYHAAYLFYHKIAQKNVSNFHLAAFCIALYFLHTKGLLSADEKCSTAL